MKATGLEAPNPLIYKAVCIGAGIVSSIYGGLEVIGAENLHSETAEGNPWIVASVHTSQYDSFPLAKAVKDQAGREMLSLARADMFEDDGTVIGKIRKFFLEEMRAFPVASGEQQDDKLGVFMDKALSTHSRTLGIYPGGKVLNPDEKTGRIAMQESDMNLGVALYALRHRRKNVVVIPAGAAGNSHLDWGVQRIAFDKPLMPEKGEKTLEFNHRIFEGMMRAQRTAEESREKALRSHFTSCNEEKAGILIRYIASRMQLPEKLN